MLYHRHTLICYIIVYKYYHNNLDLLDILQYIPGMDPSQSHILVFWYALYTLYN